MLIQLISCTADEFQLHATWSDTSPIFRRLVHVMATNRCCTCLDVWSLAAYHALAPLDLTESEIVCAKST